MLQNIYHINLLQTIMCLATTMKDIKAILMKNKQQSTVNDDYDDKNREMCFQTSSFSLMEEKNGS